MQILPLPYTCTTDVELRLSTPDQIHNELGPSFICVPNL